MQQGSLTRRVNAPAALLREARPNGVARDAALDDALPDVAISGHSAPLAAHELCAAQRTRVQIREHHLSHRLQTASYAHNRHCVPQVVKA